MFGGNPNVKTQPFKPFRFGQSPMQTGYSNPFHFGVQRQMGKMAFQPNRYGMGRGTNTTNPMRRIDLGGY